MPGCSASSRSARSARPSVERQFFHVRAQPVPRLEAVLARDHRLGVVESERTSSEFCLGVARKGRQDPEPRQGVAVPGARGVQKILGLVFQLIEIRALR